MSAEKLVGLSHTFSDGDKLVVTQVKVRDNGEPFVTFNAHSGPGVPRKQVMSLKEFHEYYGHLFPEK